MKKYTPSVTVNNKLKEEATNQLKAVLYKLEKGKYHGELDGEGVCQVLCVNKH